MPAIANFLRRRASTCRNGLLPFALTCLLAAPGCGGPPSDEALLRAEFLVPKSATVVESSVSPSEPGFFGREGLRITMTFHLDDDAYEAYVGRVSQDPTWLPLPIPEPFLARMGGVVSSKQAIVRSYVAQGKPIPVEDSVYNPSERKLLAAFVASLPPQPSNGLFQCRTAGDDVMHARKTVVVNPDRDLNDFMLAMLDRQTKRLIVRVSSSY